MEIVLSSWLSRGFRAFPLDNLFCKLMTQGLITCVKEIRHDRAIA